jgi:hypothetical protein
MLGMVDYRLVIEVFLFLSVFDKWKSGKVIVVISPWRWFWNDVELRCRITIKMQNFWVNTSTYDFKQSWESRRVCLCLLCCSLWIRNAAMESGSYSGDCPPLASCRIGVSKIMSGLIVHLTFIWLSVSFFINVKLVSSTFYSFSVICKISIIFSNGPRECLFSKRCCANFDSLFPYL